MLGTFRQTPRQGWRERCLHHRQDSLPCKEKNNFRVSSSELPRSSNHQLHDHQVNLRYNQWWAILIEPFMVSDWLLCRRVTASQTAERAWRMRSSSSAIGVHHLIVAQAEWTGSDKSGQILVSEKISVDWNILNDSFVLGCDKTQISDDVKRCNAVIIDASTTSASENRSMIDKSSRNASPVTQLEPQKSSAGFVTTVCSVFAIIFVAVWWVFYAYTHPHSNSGQFLIQYGRPTSWSWRRGTARYTAATIHMWSNALLNCPSVSHLPTILFCT